LPAFDPGIGHKARIAIPAFVRVAQLGAQQRILRLPFDPQELLCLCGIWQGPIVSKVFHGASPKNDKANILPYRRSDVTPRRSTSAMARRWL
jgi:hypothetical protein